MRPCCWWIGTIRLEYIFYRGPFVIDHIEFENDHRFDGRTSTIYLSPIITGFFPFNSPNRFLIVLTHNRVNRKGAK